MASVSETQCNLYNFIVNPSETKEESASPEQLNKRVKDCYNGALGKEVEIRKGAWTPSDESILKRVGVKYLDPEGKVLFTKLIKDPEIAQLGRTIRQLRNKWCYVAPSSLGRVIEDKTHIEILGKLCAEHPRKWAAISRLFAEMDLPNKSSGKYYPDRTIKNYFSSFVYDLKTKVPSFDELFPRAVGRPRKLEAFKEGELEVFKSDVELIVPADLKEEDLFSLSGSTLKKIRNKL